MLSQVIEYFKDPENFSILMFVGYVIILTHVMLAFVISMAWISSAV